MSRLKTTHEDARRAMLEEVDVLRARIEELETARIEELEAERDIAIADLAAARADAARYRWLRDGDGTDFSTRWSRWRVEHWASPGPTWYDIRGHNLDAAIDAALAGKEKKDA